MILIISSFGKISNLALRFSLTLLTFMICLYVLSMLLPLFQTINWLVQQNISLSRLFISLDIKHSAAILIFNRFIVLFFGISLKLEINQYVDCKLNTFSSSSGFTILQTKLYKFISTNFWKYFFSQIATFWTFCRLAILIIFIKKKWIAKQSQCFSLQKHVAITDCYYSTWSLQRFFWDVAILVKQKCITIISRNEFLTRRGIWFESKHHLNTKYIILSLGIVLEG